MIKEVSDAFLKENKSKIDRQEKTLSLFKRLKGELFDRMKGHKVRLICQFIWLFPFTYKREVNFQVTPAQIVEINLGQFLVDISVSITQQNILCAFRNLLRTRKIRAALVRCQKKRITIPQKFWSSHNFENFSKIRYFHRL